MSKFVLNTNELPTHTALTVSHWPDEQQRHFTDAVQSIREASWFKVACAQLKEADKDRVARSFAFSAFEAIQRTAVRA